MIWSGLFHINKFPYKTACSLMAAVLLSFVCLCAFAPAVAAEKETLSPSVDSVNLRQDKWIYSIYVDKNKTRYASVARYEGDDTDVVIPDKLGGYPVKVISREAFCGSRYITSVTVPDGVTDIGKYAFSNCIGLSSVTFPETLRNIGEGAFYGCRSLAGAVFPEGMTKIGSFAFYNCIHLKSVSFPSTLKSIGNSSFEGCAMLEGVAFGSELDSIGDVAFKGCRSIAGVDLSGISVLGAGAFMKCIALEKAVLGDKLGELPPEAFRSCTNLKKVVFGKSLKIIGVSAFEGCSSLKGLSGAESLTEIGSLAFLGCSSLKKAEVGKSVKKIGSGAFNGCVSLSKINVSEENGTYSSVNGCVFSKDGARLLLCPQGYKGTLKLKDPVGSIDDYAAIGCKGISDAVLGGSIASIGEAAFLGCTDITTVSVPDSVESIGAAALGMYFADGRVKKTDYIRVYASKGGCAEKYCFEHEFQYTPYDSTLFIGAERVVLTEGKTFTLACDFVSRKKASVLWDSSDESVVKVDGGKLTAVSQGSADVTASAEGFEPCVVKVVVVSDDDIGSSAKRKHESRLVYCGESEELSSLFSQIIDPIFAADRFWFSSAPSVATVTNDGKVTAHSSGTAVITCRMPDGSENIVKVTVTEKPTEFALLAPEDELLVGESVHIASTVCPSTSKDLISWESDNENVAAVDDNGNITALSQGKCTVTATASSGLKSSVEVKCVIPADSLHLDKETRNVYQGKEFNLKASVTPDQSEQKIIWRSSDPSVASVNSKGKVTGKSFGSATIIAETAGGISAECQVNVVVRAETLSIDTKKLIINKDTEYKLHAIVRPSYSPETTDLCTWNSTNEKVATVDQNGVVNAVSPGRCIINCRTGGDLISKCQVQVRLPAQSMKISAEKDSIYIGDTMPLKAVILPADSTDALEWFSDNESVASVTSGGTVRGRSSGKATITLKVTNEVTGDSITDAFEVTVMKKAESVSLYKNSLSLRTGEQDSLLYTLMPDECNDTVRWYSTDENVATVRDDGLITAVSEGFCYICIESGSGVSARCKVTVK